MGLRFSTMNLGISDLVENKNLYESMIPTKNPYGDGKASAKIVKILHNNLKFL